MPLRRCDGGGNVANLADIVAESWRLFAAGDNRNGIENMPEPSLQDAMEWANGGHDIRAMNYVADKNNIPVGDIRLWYVTSLSKKLKEGVEIGRVEAERVEDNKSATGYSMNYKWATQGTTPTLSMGEVLEKANCKEYAYSAGEYGNKLREQCPRGKVVYTAHDEDGSEWLEVGVRLANRFAVYFGDDLGYAEGTQFDGGDSGDDCSDDCGEILTANTPSEIVQILQDKVGGGGEYTRLRVGDTVFDINWDSGADCYECDDGQGNSGSYNEKGMVRYLSKFLKSNADTAKQSSGDIAREDIINVAFKLNILLSETEISNIIEMYPEEHEQDPDASWNLITENCIYRVVGDREHISNKNVAEKPHK